MKILFNNLETDISLNEFLEDFPSVSKPYAIALLDVVSRVINTKNAA